MSIGTRFIISLVVAIPFTAMLLDSESEMYITSLLMWGYTLTMGLFTVVSLYSSKHYAVQKTESGEPIPVFKRSSSNREKIGGYLLATFAMIFATFMVISGSMDVKEAYEFAKEYESLMLGPAGFVAMIGIYLYMTHKCIFCGSLNTTTSDTCKVCDLYLPKHSLKEFSEKQT